MLVLELVKLFINFSLILPPADSELNHTTWSPQSWQAKVLGEKPRIFQRAFT